MRRDGNHRVTLAVRSPYADPASDHRHSCGAEPAHGYVLFALYRCDLGYGAKPWLIVSNNARNRHTADVLEIRLTTTARQLPTWVPLSASDPLGGYANADNIETLGKDELGNYLGALSVTTMTRVNTALAMALALPAPS